MAPVIKLAKLDPSILKFDIDSGLGKAKKAKILADVKKNGFKYPISVTYNGIYRVTWGKSRAWAALMLRKSVPAVIFEQKAGAEGEVIEDPRTLFDCPTLYKPHKALIAPQDRFWT